MSLFSLRIYERLTCLSWVWLKLTSCLCFLFYWLIFAEFNLLCLFFNFWPCLLASGQSKLIFVIFFIHNVQQHFNAEFDYCITVLVIFVWAVSRSYQKSYYKVGLIIGELLGKSISLTRPNLNIYWLWILCLLANVLESLSFGSELYKYWQIFKKICYMTENVNNWNEYRQWQWFYRTIIESPRKTIT
jgi:hypothetical protein